MKRFFIRLLGLTALFVGVAGLAGVLSESSEKIGLFRGVSWVLLLCGAAVAVTVLIAEISIGMKESTGRRSTAGGMVVFQIALAAVLLIGVNAFSMRHYHRWDC